MYVNIYVKIITKKKGGCQFESRRGMEGIVRRKKGESNVILLFFYLILFIFISCVFMFCLHANMYVRSPETGVTGSYELPCGRWELNWVL